MDKAARFKLENILFSLFIVCVIIIALQSARQWPLRAGILVYVLGAIGLVLALFQLGTDIRSIFHEPTEAKGMSFEAPLPETNSRWGDLEIWAWLVGLYAFIWVIGFPYAMTLWVLLYAKVYGSRWVTAMSLAVITWVFIFGLFDRIMHVPWPESLLLG